MSQISPDKENINNRIRKIFLYESTYIDDAEIISAVNTYLTSPCSIDDINDLQIKLKAIHILKTYTEISKSSSVLRLLYTVTHEYIMQLLEENIILDIDLLSNNYKTSAKLVENLSIFKTILESSLGNTRIAPVIPITVKSCTKSEDSSAFSEYKFSADKDIYTTSNEASQVIYNMLQCYKWADTNNELIISITGLSQDCKKITNKDEALIRCMHYLHPSPDSEL
ncbi:MAG: hypothetical protein AABY27_00835 [Pseudomonadota bacterium]